MCILFIYTNPNPQKGGYRLIIASNRDEYYKRPAKKAFLCQETNIIGGRDMEPGREGGMWLGLSIKPPMIKFATLLNVTGEKKQATSGRGPLVYNYLKTPNNTLDFINNLKSTNKYSAFNLVMLEITRNGSNGYHFSNSPEATLEYHNKQILAFGNSTPDVPFTKVKKGRNIFEGIVKETTNRTELVDKLLNLLKCEDLHLPDPELERRAPEGINFLSGIFVKTEVYGTRTHSIVLVDEEGNIEFIEHTMKEPIDGINPQWDVTVIKSQL